MNLISIEKRRLAAGAITVILAGALVFGAKGSHGQNIGAVLRERARISQPPNVPAPPGGLNRPVVNGRSQVQLTQAKRLILSAEGSNIITPVVSGRINQGVRSDGEIWLTVSYDDGSPFGQGHAADVHLEALGADAGGARLDVASSRPAEGLWHFLLPDLKPGSHFYRVRVESHIPAWNSDFAGQAIVRASYTRMPYWNAQRPDGTIWTPPK